MKYKIITFGCQFNLTDAERVAAVLEKIGYVKAATESEADLIMVLACSVRQTAIDRIYGLNKKFSQLKQKKPVITILSGCVLKSDLEKMKKIFDLIFEIKDLANLPKLLAAKNSLPKTCLPAARAKSYFAIRPVYESKFRVEVPIMTGCNNFCTYCVVPYVRGREISRPAQAVISECKDLISQGYKEIILLGQNVNSYRSEIRNQKSEIRNFPDLLKAIDDIPGDYWLTFVTSHPKDLSDKLIKTMAAGRHIMFYLHLPVQSGDNEILKKMNRRYTVSHYQNLIRKVRKAVPKISISTDTIVGFPGETKKQFANTLKLFEAVKFDMAYLAQYSSRSGTAAAKLADNVAKTEKAKREKALNQVLARTALANNQKMIGKTVKVLVEKYQPGFCFGKTSNFKNVKFSSAVDYTGQFVLVKIVSCYAWGLNGELPKAVVILGPTSTGKTKLAVKLAKKFNGEIISADSRQVYQGMDIGTGKDLKEYGKIPYHLIDIISPKKQLTLAQWQALACQKLGDILQRGKLPIICGGTGLYISALVEGYIFQKSENRNQKTEHIRSKLNKLTLKQLLARLKKVDFKTHQIIDQNNRRRVQRALEIYYQTGQTKSEQLKKQPPPDNFLLLGLNFPKAVLHRRIEKRLKHRLEVEGLIAEVKRLRKQGVSWQRLDDFGLEYRWVSRYLQKKISRQELFEGLKKAIFDFAKRQMTWFSRQLSGSKLPSEERDKTVIWLQDFPSAENEVRQFLKK
ncbi:MAG: tRNA (N6-isopentenyl adenosine(37)-C2)-methylthiotransferase MiaB [Patescibacteria group bacterium]|jgi:tRNA-2-methylthio-N6-dimethylallyladenosine synthase